MNDWIEWNGGICPIPDAKAGKYDVNFRHEKVEGETDAKHLRWLHIGNSCDIIAYRLIEPEQSTVEVLKDAIQDALDTFTFEINPSNYDHDQVCLLNDQMIEVVTNLQGTLDLILIKDRKEGKT